jgi:hypothetical protein
MIAWILAIDSHSSINRINVVLVVGKDQLGGVECGCVFIDFMLEWVLLVFTDPAVASKGHTHWTSFIKGFRNQTTLLFERIKNLL